MSAAAPGSADDTKDEPKPEPVGFLTKLMGKESCVVGLRVRLMNELSATSRALASKFSCDNIPPCVSMRVSP